MYKGEDGTVEKFWTSPYHHSKHVTKYIKGLGNNEVQKLET